MLFTVSIDLTEQQARSLAILAAIPVLPTCLELGIDGNIDGSYFPKSANSPAEYPEFALDCLDHATLEFWEFPSKSVFVQLPVSKLTQVQDLLTDDDMAVIEYHAFELHSERDYD